MMDYSFSDPTKNECGHFKMESWQIDLIEYVKYERVGLLQMIVCD